MAIEILYSFLFFQGRPEFNEFSHDCQYSFTWRTSLVCPNDETESISSCSIEHNRDWKVRVELSRLFKPNGYRVPFHDKVFFINVCGSVCNLSSVCTDKGASYGGSTLSLLRWMGNTLQLMYFGGDTCRKSVSGKRTTTIHFICDENAGFGTPEADSVMSDLECMAVFNWKTNLTCLEALQDSSTTTISSTSINNTSTDSSSIINTTPSAEGTTSKTPSESDLSGIKGVSYRSGLLGLIIVILLATVVVIAVMMWRKGFVSRFFNWARMTHTGGPILG